ncbi:MAG: hypothetical protein NT092_12405, partial [Bacteroidia bacterium]|nr:hypothetical protein [Bacteroidia bacterium]
LLALGGDDSSTDYKGGWTCGAGTGFRWPMGGFESYIKFGFRYGFTVRVEDNYYYYDDINGSPFPTEYTYHSNFYRLEMKWGFKF